MWLKSLSEALEACKTDLIPTPPRESPAQGDGFQGSLVSDRRVSSGEGQKRWPPGEASKTSLAFKSPDGYAIGDLIEVQGNSPTLTPEPAPKPYLMAPTIFVRTGLPANGLLSKILDHLKILLARLAHRT